jgi:hypothetical protein
MSLEGRARARFAALLEREPVPLDEAALALAEEEYPSLDVEEYLVRLDELAGRALARAGVAPASRLAALRHVLHEEEGLRGNEKDYYDPRNSFLNDVLDRRLGIPISLSVVWIEVARRAGVVLEGIGFPGHFLARYASPSGQEVYVDAFHGGEMLSVDECVARYRARTGGRELDRRHWSAGTTCACSPCSTGSSSSRRASSRPCAIAASSRRGSGPAGPRRETSRPTSRARARRPTRGRCAACSRR